MSENRRWVELKDGTMHEQERRWRDRVDGLRQRYWFNIPEEEEDDNLFDIVEWVLHWEYRDGSPSGQRNWEVRIRVPRYYEEDNVSGLAEEILQSYVNEELINSSNFNIDKKGTDIIEEDGIDEIRYKVIDTVRPQYNYPKGKWGRWKK